MSHKENIEKIYRHFLESELDPQVGKTLCQVLHQVGLHGEGQALEAYCKHNFQVIHDFEDSTWGKRRCFIGPDLPSQAEPGDLWFDIVELTSMILVPAPHTPMAAAMREWVSTHPVYVWQFRTFLSLVDWRLARKYFMNASDLMETNRFESMSSMAFITNVYHEEAVAYAHWFGKQLAGQFTLEAAREFSEPKEFSGMLPQNVRLWDGAEYSSSEFVRIAIGHDTLDKDPDNEFELRESGKNQLLADRMLFEEWERRPNIGFSTAVSLQIGLIKELPRLGYEFLELQNAAPRS